MEMENKQLSCPNDECPNSGTIFELPTRYCDLCGTLLVEFEDEDETPQV